MSYAFPYARRGPPTGADRVALADALMRMGADDIGRVVPVIDRRCVGAVRRVRPARAAAATAGRALDTMAAG